MRILLMGWLCLFATMTLANDEINQDPWEGFNRVMFTFNDQLDQHLVRPLAVGYQTITPKPVSHSVSHFFGNLEDVLIMSNNFAQLKFKQGFSDIGRILVNTTVGFFGIFDVASNLGLKKHNEDFGQTLGYWGVESGPYLMLPFLGPSTVRDAGGSLLSYGSGLSFTGLGDTYPQQLFLYGARGIDLRESFIASEGLITGDRYLFFRSFYLQRREYLIRDGEQDDPFDDGWDDDWEGDWEGDYEDR